jgi:hypothetical protein
MNSRFLLAHWLQNKVTQFPSRANTFIVFVCHTETRVTGTDLHVEARRTLFVSAEVDVSQRNANVERFIANCWSDPTSRFVSRLIDRPSEGGS